jgi:hypothetical protein
MLRAFLSQDRLHELCTASAAGLGSVGSGGSGGGATALRLVFACRGAFVRMRSGDEYVLVQLLRGEVNDRHAVRPVLQVIAFDGQLMERAVNIRSVPNDVPTALEWVGLSLFTRVFLQSKRQLMTFGVVYVTNLTRASGNPNHQLMTPSMVHVTDLTPPGSANLASGTSTRTRATSRSDKGGWTGRPSSATS